MEKVVKFEIWLEAKEIGRCTTAYERGDIANQNVCGAFWYSPKKVAAFDTEEEALAELKKYKSECWIGGGYIGELLYAEEYWIEKVTYDKDNDGELTFDTGAVLEVAPLNDWR